MPLNVFDNDRIVGLEATVNVRGAKDGPLHNVTAEGVPRSQARNANDNGHSVGIKFR